MKTICTWAVILAALTGIAPALTAAEPSLPRVTFTDQHLSNGLRVIIAPEHTAPVFGIAVTYNVGSRNERPGRTGFAHLFEHMMFEGSKNVGKGEHFILVFNNGGNMNGTTNEDRTNYFETLPKNQLDLALFLESDRMRSLNVNQANLDNQRSAVQEERRLGIDNQPYGKSYLEIDNLAYDNFGYKHSTIGSMEDLNAASVEDVQAFFQTYYAPNNAVLTLVGDLDPAETLAKVEKYFGDIPRQPDPPAVDMTEPEHDGERRETIMDPLARAPLLLMAYQIPPGNTRDNYTLQVLQSVLGGGESSRLYQHLVKEKQLATQVQARADARRGPSLFYVWAFLRPGVKPEDAEKAVLEDISAVQKNGITPAELEKAHRQYLRAQIGNRQADLGEAITLGRDAVFFNDPNLINTELAKFDAITASEVRDAARKYLVPTGLAVVTTLPQSPAPGAAEGP